MSRLRRKAWNRVALMKGMVAPHGTVEAVSTPFEAVRYLYPTPSLSFMMRQPPFVLLLLSRRIVVVAVK